MQKLLFRFIFLFFGFFVFPFPLNIIPGVSGLLEFYRKFWDAPENLGLLNRGFNWVNEVPDNRDNYE